MIRKIIFSVSLPMLVMPFISLGAAPTLAASLQDQPKLKLELLSARNSKSVLIADQYRDRDDYQRRDRDNYQRRDSDYYRSWYNNHHNQYKGYSYRWYNNHYHGDYDHYYRWYYSHHQ